jgi:flagellar biosynthesis/type III secretory pathway protein FliH
LIRDSAAEQIVREFLNSGYSKKAILKGIKSVMESVPKGERQPSLYLAQNLRGHMEHFKEQVSNAKQQFEELLAKASAEGDEEKFRAMQSTLRRAQSGH